MQLISKCQNQVDTDSCNRVVNKKFILKWLHYTNKTILSMGKAAVTLCHQESDSRWRKDEICLYQLRSATSISAALGLHFIRSLIRPFMLKNPGSIQSRPTAEVNSFVFPSWLTQLDSKVSYSKEAWLGKRHYWLRPSPCSILLIDIFPASLIFACCCTHTAIWYNTVHYPQGTCRVQWWIMEE